MGSLILLKLVKSSSSLGIGLDALEKITQFSLISNTNSSKYHKFVVEKLIELIQEFAWIISAANNFNAVRLKEILFKQLDPITIAIQYAIKSVFNRESVSIVLKLITVFYEFMTRLTANVSFSRVFFTFKVFFVKILAGVLWSGF